MPDYTRPTEFTTGQLLGRASAGVLRDNDDYFWGLAHAWQPIPATHNDPTDVLWQGWHYYQPGASKLHYYVRMDSGNSVRFWYDYNDQFEQLKIVHLTVADTVTQDNNVWWNDDISKHSVTGADRPEGLYHVRAVADGVGECLPMYTTYTGDQSYGTPPVVLDGETSSTGLYNRARLNDLYFNDCQPVQVAFSGMSMADVPAGSVLWDGRTYHRGTRLWYAVEMGDDSSDLKIYYDYAGSNQQEIVHTTTKGVNSSYVDIDTTNYTYNPGSRYAIRALLDGRATIHWMYIEPQTTDPGPGIDPAVWRYYVMDEFTVGNIVGGRANVPFVVLTDMSLLSGNDRHIFSALCTSAKIGTRNYASRRPQTVHPVSGATQLGAFYLVRRYDTLVYRTTDAEMAWANNTESLDDSGTEIYRTLDLRSLDLAYGMPYSISGALLQYAAEIP